MTDPLTTDRDAALAGSEPQPDAQAASDAEASPDDGTAGPEVGSPAAPASPRPPRWAILGWVVAVLALLLAGTFVYLWAGLQTAATEREQVRRAGERLVLQITTFEGESIEEWVADLKARSTGEYALQVEALFDQGLRDELREAEARSVGELQRLFVQSVEGDEAEVFAIVRQTIVNNALTDPVQDELRMDLTMRRVDGRWLASRVAVLAPTGVTVAPPPPPLDEEPGS